MYVGFYYWRGMGYNINRAWQDLFSLQKMGDEKPNRFRPLFNPRDNHRLFLLQFYY